jgi:sporulation protein YlmC with PRC-barrel domain
MDNMKHRRLQELDRSDFEIVGDEHDIRGWDVKTADGKKIGEVEELIIDAQQRKVRYMVVDLDDNDVDLEDRKVLVPIGIANLHEKDDDVILPDVNVAQLSSLPEYDRDRLDPDTERRICSAFGRQSTSETSTGELHSEFYQHDYYNDDNLYKHRLHEAQPVQKQESEYERGLRLWEKRSQGGILTGSSSTGRRERSEQPGIDSEREIPENSRMEMVRNRRNAYEQKRGGGSGREQYQSGRSSRRRDNTIEGRIRDEGLRDA